MTTLLEQPPSSEIRDLTRFRELFEPELLAWLSAKEGRFLNEAAETAELTSRLRDFVGRGGKRLRPALAYFGYYGCGGDDRRTALSLAMSTELLHTYLLIHDDIMDDASLRRGGRTAHLLFEADHRARRWSGDPRRHGESVAILLGDLAHSYAVEHFLDVQSRVNKDGLMSCFATMCQEVVVGQYLEMTAPYRDNPSRDDLMTVLRLKSGRYSVERPVALGAIAASAPESVLKQLTVFGRNLGEAFQLKDDLLGVFGVSATVGKSVDSDIAEGKLTVLVQQALERSGDADRELLRSALGNRAAGETQLAQARDVVEASGARAEVERMIEARLERAAQALDGIELAAGAQGFYSSLIDFSRDREH